MNWKFKYAMISFALGFSMLGLNLSLIADATSWGPVFGIVASLTLIIMGVFDYTDYRREQKDEQL